jgi:hypothetical protein
MIFAEPDEQAVYSYNGASTTSRSTAFHRQNYFAQARVFEQTGRNDPRVDIFWSHPDGSSDDLILL